MKETGQKNNEKRLEAGIKKYVEYVTTNLIRLNSAAYTYEVNYNSNTFNFYFPHEKHFKHLSATAEDIKSALNRCCEKAQTKGTWFYKAYESIKEGSVSENCHKANNINYNKIRGINIDAENIRFAGLPETTEYVFPFSEDKTCVSIYIEETDELDILMGVYTSENHNEAFQINYYGLQNTLNKFYVVAEVTIYDKDLLYTQFPEISKSVINLNEKLSIVPLRVDELQTIKDKFIQYLIDFDC